MTGRRLRRWAAAVVSVLVALGAAVGLGAVVALLVFGRLPDADEAAVVPASALAAALAAVAFEPLRRGTADAARRLRRDPRRDPDEVVATFGERASRGVPVDELLHQLVESLRRTMALAGAEIWVVDGEVVRRAVAVPTAPADELAVQPEEVAALTRTGVAGEAWLAHWVPTLAAVTPPGAVRIAPARQGGALLGALMVRRPALGDPFTAAEDRALGELGRRLGDLLRNRQLDAALRATLDDLRISNRELRASRARLVAAADAERRRIERDLHDGAQQHLVALAVNLGLAREAVATDPDGVVDLLDRLAADVRQAVAEVRDLARGIYPPLLSEQGIGEALRAVARRVPQPVTVVADDLPRFSAEAETAVYFCCVEAIQNAVKHAPGARVVVEVHRTGDVVALEVRDDGPGFDPAQRAAGSGLQGMADRLGAVGGTLALSSEAGAGTTVRGSVAVADRGEP